MSSEDTPRPPDETSHFTGEEGGEERATPHKDFGAAVVIGALAIAAMVLSLGLEVPTTTFTAPGLFPFLTGLSLLAMAIGLGASAVRAGGARGYKTAMREGAHRYFAQQENRRTLLLMAVLFGYILLVGHIGFDLRIPTQFFVFEFSSWEAISMPVLAAILRFFWRGPWWQCGLFSVIMIFALASVFRHAFHILLPAAG